MRTIKQNKLYVPWNSEKIKKKLLSLIMLLLALLVFALFPNDAGKSKGDCMKSCISITPSVLKTKIWYTEKSQVKDKHSIKPEVLNSNIYIHTK